MSKGGQGREVVEKRTRLFLILRPPILEQIDRSGDRLTFEA
jgi:hypothetical protein